MSSNKMYVLSYEEYCRLDEVLARVIQIHGRGNFPTLEVQPKEFIKLFTDSLNQKDFAITDCRLNGSTASYVLNDQSDEKDDYTYNDLDLIFHVKLASSADYTLIKNTVLEMFDTMKRPFEFSVDSFQIVLDSLLNFPGVSADLKPSSTLYPSVEAESVYGNFEEARYHLRNKLIATKNPEEIRGGGLLKYCSLLSRDFLPESQKIQKMEKYMCSRFFIDFKDVHIQQQKLENYLKSHSLDSVEKRYKYLNILYDVVQSSTVCLMGHERRQTLRMIHGLLNQVYHATNFPQVTVFYSVPPYMQQSRYNVSHSYSASNDYVMLGSWKAVPSTDSTKAVRCY